jgi:hypothetical protein
MSRGALQRAPNDAREVSGAHSGRQRIPRLPVAASGQESRVHIGPAVLGVALGAQRDDIWMVNMNGRANVRVFTSFFLLGLISKRRHCLSKFPRARSPGPSAETRGFEVQASSRAAPIGCMLRESSRGAIARFGEPPLQRSYPRPLCGAKL